jgi:hypothetical protein
MGYIWGTFSFIMGYIAGVHNLSSEIGGLFEKTAEIKREAWRRAQSRSGYFRKREKIVVYNKSTRMQQSLNGCNVIFLTAVRDRHMHSHWKLTFTEKSNLMVLVLLHP